MHSRHLVLFMVLSLGCDPRAGGGKDRPDRASTELESCAATSDCAGELRCRSGICRSPATVAVGEYHGAAGRQALLEQRYEDAIAEYSEATKAFELGKVAVPAEIHCGHGEALQRAGGDPQRFELAARVLHRCLLGSPVGTELRTNALRLLAELGKEGLDPQLLGKETLSDRYMTGQPAQPPTDDLVLTVTSNEKVKSYTFDKWMERAKSDEVRTALLPCWEEHWRATREVTMTVSLPMKHSFKLDQYGDFDRSTLVVADLTPVGDTATDGARNCAKAAIEPIADDHTKGRDDERRWDAELTFTLAPADANAAGK